MTRHILAAALALTVPAALPAQDTARVSRFAPRLTVAADLVSTYAFRGVDLTGAPAVQPWATVELGSTGLSLTAWASVTPTGRDRVVPSSTTLTRGGSDEVDLTAALARTVGPVELGAGYVAYLYPSHEQDYVTQELYGTLGLPSAPLAPRLSVYYDFDGGEDDEVDPVRGLYASLGVAHSVPLRVPVDVAASVGYTRQEALRGGAGFNDAGVSLGSDFAFGRLTVAPTMGYTRLFTGSAYIAEGDDVVWGRVEVRLAF